MSIPITVDKDTAKNVEAEDPSVGTTQNMRNNEPFLSEQDIDLLKRTILKSFSEDQQETFIKIAQRTRLDPFSRQIYATRRMSHGTVTLVTVTGIQGLSALAERTGQYDGCQIFWAGADGVWRDEWLQEDYPAAAKCVVYHKGHTYPEVGIARWNSYVGRSYNSVAKRWDVSEFWDKMPDLMLSKCARALALRGAFPDHLSGLYATEELDQAGSADQFDDEAKIIENRKREAELLAKAQGSKVKVVSKPTTQSTPAAAAQPAFPEDAPQTIPAPPVETPKLAAQEPDDLDMGPEPPPEPAPQSPEGEPRRELATPWKSHVIHGLKNPKFFGRTVGELTPAELTAIESSWIPKVRAVWETVNKLQREDCAAFEAAIAFSKMEKPW